MDRNTRSSTGNVSRRAWMWVAPRGRSAHASDCGLKLQLQRRSSRHGQRGMVRLQRCASGGGDGDARLAGLLRLNVLGEQHPLSLLPPAVCPCGDVAVGNMASRYSGRELNNGWWNDGAVGWE